MDNDLKEFFIYTRSERNGMFVLVFICVALVITPMVYKQFFYKQSKTDFSEFQSQIDSFFQDPLENVLLEELPLFPFNPNTASVEEFQKLGLSKKVASTIVNYRNKGGTFYKKEDFKKIYGISELDYERLKDFIVLEDDFQNFDAEKLNKEVNQAEYFELFEFNPNTATENELKRLGLSPKVIRTMMNYRGKGGTFRKREDLSKIYGISEDDFERLFPYIKIPENQETNILASIEKTERKKTDNNSQNPTIEINTATPEEWQQLKGIGPYYSKKICGFRDALGGFVTIDQIAETYGFPDSTFQKIKPFLRLEGSVQKIDLNTATAAQLAAHPYLKWKQANAIVKYREQHGAFKNLNQLDNIKIVNQETLNRIKPYLK